VSLGRYDPAAGAWETAVAGRRLREALMAVEIGNEPNAFWFHGLRPPGWRYADYRQEIRAYRSAIAAAAPGVPIAGPDTALLDDYSWLETFAREEHPSLLTPHHYPLHRCYRAPPTIADLLHPTLAEEEARVLRTFAQIGRRHGLPVRVGETNSVGCWGQPGVSNTFAASLWALRYMLASTRAGIVGVNFHTHPGLCDGYSPICAGTRPRYAAGRLRRMPMWYALLLYRQLVGKRLVGVSHAPELPGVTIEAFRGTTGAALDVVAVNTRPRPVRLALRVRGHREARAGTVWRLAAPALDSRHRVRLVGEPVTTRGPLAVPGSSAALVRLESPSSLPAR
jgi:hypothetical protein